MKALTKIFLLSFLGVTMLTACNSSSQLGCTATPNGLSFHYPCETSEPSESKGGGVLTSWDDSKIEEVNGEAIQTSKIFQVERYTSELGAKEWAEDALKAEGDAQDFTVFGEPSVGYLTEEGDEQVWSVVTKKEDVIYLTRLTASHPDASQREKYMNQLMDIMETLELSNE